ncbi:MAG: hypothetical protein AAF918_15160 [Pseudomonadota bacterium]
MQATPPNWRDEFQTIILWSVATLLFCLWAPASFFPIVGAARAWGDPAAVLIQLAFFATGVFGLLVAFLAVQWLRVPQPQTEESEDRQGPSNRLTRIKVLTLYAVVWLTAYSWLTLA